MTDLLSASPHFMTISGSDIVESGRKLLLFIDPVKMGSYSSLEPFSVIFRDRMLAHCRIMPAVPLLKLTLNY